MADDPRPRSSPCTQEFKRQGNADFYTKKNLTQRRKLRSDPEINQWLERFVDTFVSVDKNGKIAREELLSVQVVASLSRRLRPRFVSAPSNAKASRMPLCVFGPWRRSKCARCVQTDGTRPNRRRALRGVKAEFA